MSMTENEAIEELKHRREVLNIAINALEKIDNIKKNY